MLDNPGCSDVCYYKNHEVGKIIYYKNHEAFRDGFCTAGFVVFVIDGFVALTGH